MRNNESITISDLSGKKEEFRLLDFTDHSQHENYGISRLSLLGEILTINPSEENVAWERREKREYRQQIEIFPGNFCVQYVDFPKFEEHELKKLQSIVVVALLQELQLLGMGEQARNIVQDHNNSCR